MGYLQAMGACIGCGRMFMFNPYRVPSLTVHGTREPICIDCVERANVRRKANGLDPIVPLPGAYDAIDEQGDLYAEGDDW